MKFKVGDKVRVVTNISSVLDKYNRTSDGLFVSQPMSTMEGTTLTIQEIQNEELKRYKVKENSWIWDDNILELGTFPPKIGASSFTKIPNITSLENYLMRYDISFDSPNLSKNVQKASFNITIEPEIKLTITKNTYKF